METGKVIELSAEPRSRERAIEALHEHGPMLLAAARVITLDDDEAQAKDLLLGRPTVKPGTPENPPQGLADPGRGELASW